MLPGVSGIVWIIICFNKVALAHLEGIIDRIQITGVLSMVAQPYTATRLEVFWIARQDLVYF